MYIIAILAIILCILGAYSKIYASIPHIWIEISITDGKEFYHLYEKRDWWDQPVFKGGYISNQAAFKQMEYLMKVWSEDQK